MVANEWSTRRSADNADGTSAPRAISRHNGWNPRCPGVATLYSTT